MVRKILFINSENCIGCRTCEVACSLQSEAECNPAKSRIHIIKWEKERLNVPMVCQQCDEPICEAVCPTKAISRCEETGAMLINYDICIGCKMCAIACPLGGISITDGEKKVIKCDLCEGDPACAKFCCADAIQYTSSTKAILMKKREATKKLGELMKLLVETGPVE